MKSELHVPNAFVATKVLAEAVLNWSHRNPNATDETLAAAASHGGPRYQHVAIFRATGQPNTVTPVGGPTVTATPPTVDVKQNTVAAPSPLPAAAAVAEGKKFPPPKLIFLRPTLITCTYKDPDTGMSGTGDMGWFDPLAELLQIMARGAIHSIRGIRNTRVDFIPA